MRTNDTSQIATNQANIFTREQLIERDRINKDRYRLAQLSHNALASRLPSRTESQALEKKWTKLPPKAKAILNHLDGRSEKWASQPYNQQWIAKSVDCTLRWVRECIRRLKDQGFLAIVRINKGKPFKTPVGFWTYPNIYIVTPFWKWSQSAKLYSLIVAAADKIQREFLQYSNMIKEYIKRDNKFVLKERLGIKSISHFFKVGNILNC